MPKKSRATTETPTKPTLKSEFILAHPGLPAKDIVAKGKDAGLALTEKYIYTIRSVDRSRKLHAALRAAPGGGLRTGTGAAAETLLVSVAAELGLGRAIEVLESHRRTVLGALGK
ncbi:MAG: hypothetical protein IT373_25815 [Polyangiaceae bacterium]|nr:hypothetical protein [Polyangiaceae bacterium]